MIAENLPLDKSEYSLSQILDDVRDRGLDPQELESISILEFVDEYRSITWLVREIAKLDRWQQRPQPVKRQRKTRQRLHKTPGRSAGTISKDMIFSEAVDNV